MYDLRSELREARDASGLTWDDVVERSGLDVDQSTMLRKISGGQPLHFDEAVKIADALGVPTADLHKAHARASAVGATLMWAAVKVELPSAPKSRARRRAA